MAKKNLQNFTRLSKSTSKNVEILFVHYLFTKSVSLFNNSKKEWVQKNFYSSECMSQSEDLNEWCDLVLPL